MTDMVRALPPSRQDAAAMAGVTPLTILSELMRLAIVDIGEAFDAAGNLKPIHEIPEDVRRAMAGVDVSEIYSGTGGDREMIGVLKKVKFWDKLRALEVLAKHLGLLVERVKLEDSNDDLADLIRAARKRAAMAPPLEREANDEVSERSPVPAAHGAGAAGGADGDPAERRAGAVAGRGDDRGRAAELATGAAGAGEPGHRQGV
jgi:phage terminase small subunit